MAPELADNLQPADLRRPGNKFFLSRRERFADGFVASKTKIQSPVAWASANFWRPKNRRTSQSDKSSRRIRRNVQGRSVEPVSTTMISSAIFCTLARQRARQRASF